MRRGSRGLKLDYAALHARYVAGESGTAIAREVGIDCSGLYVSWKRRGYAIRSIRDAKRLGAQQRPELARLIEYATAKRRGAVDPIAVREARARTREARMLGTSALEDRIAGWLDEAGVRYVRQKAIGPYNVDFALDGGVVIEVDGGGHNPRVRAKAPERLVFIESMGWTVRNLNRRHVTREALHGVTAPG